MNHSLPGSSVHGISPGKNTGVASHSLLQGILPTQDQTQVSCIAGWFFTIWAIWETPIGSIFLTLSSSSGNIFQDGSLNHWCDTQQPSPYCGFELLLHHHSPLNHIFPNTPTSCWFRHSELSDPQSSRLLSPLGLHTWYSFPPYFIQQTPASSYDLISSVLSRRKLAMTPSMGEGSLCSYCTLSHPVITHLTQEFKFLFPWLPPLDPWGQFYSSSYSQHPSTITGTQKVFLPIVSLPFNRI